LNNQEVFTLATIITAEGAFGGGLAICAHCGRELVEYFDAKGEKRFVVFMANANEGFKCPDGREHSVVHTGSK
jgi:hypothetical protein